MAEAMDDIKAIWQKSKEGKEAPVVTLDSIQNHRPKTTLYWIKVILWTEFVLNFVLAPFVIIYIVNRGDSVWFIGFYALLIIVYSFYYQFLIRSINRFTYDGDVIHNLKKVYGYLRFYLLHYKVVVWLSLLGGFIYGLIDGILHGGPEAGIPDDADLKFWLITLGISSFILLAIGGIFHFLIHLIYGRKIRRLKKTIKSLEDEK